MAMHEHETDKPTPHEMVAKQEGECYECGEQIYEGDSIVWDPNEHKAYCSDCGQELL